MSTSPTPLEWLAPALAAALLLGLAAGSFFQPAPPTCVRQFDTGGRLVQQWTTDSGARLAPTAWSLTVHGEALRVTGNLVEFPGPCVLEASR
ncbi:hypothetical protein [Deinococcus wulumuqiensis]|uniref:hypothetical protein n=1 Tax=Deinococcus wulumuqiensis TaxID=980427 RepID=UPI0024308ED0|nr:hypothetical protein [Deinococcus wulumuqiensis]